jgi:predicted transglutaminase-like cysteine proteinase
VIRFFQRGRNAQTMGAALVFAVAFSMFSSETLADSKKATANNPSTTVTAASEDRQIARYFTISEVLAKLDKQDPNTNTQRQVQVAALDPTRALPPASEKQGSEPFGFVTFRAPEGALWVKWRKLEAELSADAQTLAKCRADSERCANPAAQKFLKLIEESRRLGSLAKIDRINRTINSAIRYTSDREQFGVPDLWSAPLATLRSGKGDCEDYAIAKYVALRDAGFSTNDLRLLIVRDRVAREDHMVAGVRVDGRWLMLDNRHDVMLEKKDAWHFTPLFALDQHGVNLFAAQYEEGPATVPAITSTGRAATAEQSKSNGQEATNAEAIGLRVDTFNPPELRGGI